MMAASCYVGASNTKIAVEESFCFNIAMINVKHDNILGLWRLEIFEKENLLDYLPVFSPSYLPEKEEE